MKKSTKKTAGKPAVFRYLLSILAYDLFLIVRTASLANSVRNHKRTALAAFNKCGSGHFPVCSSFISSSLGRLILRTN